MANMSQAMHLVHNGCLVHWLIQLGNGLRGWPEFFLIPLACGGTHHSAGFLLQIAHEYLPVFKINQC